MIFIKPKTFYESMLGCKILVEQNINFEGCRPTVIGVGGCRTLDGCMAAQDVTPCATAGL